MLLWAIWFGEVYTLWGIKWEQDNEQPLQGKITIWWVIFIDFYSWISLSSWTCRTLGVLRWSLRKSITISFWTSSTTLSLTTASTYSTTPSSGPTGTTPHHLKSHLAPKRTSTCSNPWRPLTPNWAPPQGTLTNKATRPNYQSQPENPTNPNRQTPSETTISPE